MARGTRAPPTKKLKKTTLSPPSSPLPTLPSVVQNIHSTLQHLQHFITSLTDQTIMEDNKKLIKMYDMLQDVVLHVGLDNSSTVVCFLSFLSFLFFSFNNLFFFFSLLLLQLQNECKTFSCSFSSSSGRACDGPSLGRRHGSTYTF
jgi:hypothetical protein